MDVYKNQVSLTSELKSLIEQIFQQYYAIPRKYGNAEMDLNEFLEDMVSGFKLTKNTYPNEEFIVIGGNEFDISYVNITQWESNLKLIKSFLSLGGSAAMVYEKLDKNKPAYILQKQSEDSMYYALIEIK